MNTNKGEEEYIGKLFFNNALQLSKSKDFDSAMVHYNNAIKFVKPSDPLRLQSLSNIANAYYNKHEFAKAKNVLIQLKKLDSNYINVQTSLDALDRLLLQEDRQK